MKDVSYRDEIEAAQDAPEKLERLFRIVLKENNEAVFGYGIAELIRVKVP